MNYNWRDIERRVKRLGIPFSGRPPYPVDPQLLALRVGTVAAAQGGCADYTGTTFRSWFLDGKASGLPENVERVLASLGKPTAQIIAKAGELATEALLKDETEAAQQLGIFGSPSFACGQEIFWGDDRLEDAVAFATA